MVSLASAVLPDTTARSGTIDYRLQRKRVLDDIQAGNVSTDDVCDAHPELLRVAKNAAAEVGEVCPICEIGVLRVVGYAFGTRLSNGGKCVLNGTDLRKITQREGVFNIYEIEVCPDCGWNYRLRSYRIETAQTAGKTAGKSAS